MGRLVLLRVVLPLVLAAACVRAPDRVADAGSGHDVLACAVCHDGPSADRDLPSVTPASCTEARCHRDAGPDRVELSTVTFDHRGHGADTAVAMTCAGCHTHAIGGAPLSGSTDACALCHADELGGETPSDCHGCHENPEHTGTTSQGLSVGHAGLPWLGGACVRCHYDVSEPEHQVGSARCLSCHADAEAMTRDGLGIDLHPSHTGVACTTCHTGEGHRIVAMSSAVDLDCADCHAVAHGVPLGADAAQLETCGACHGDAHRAQQRLVLGILPSAAEAQPSDKFMDGLTCRSCHVSDATAPGAPAGSGAAGASRSASVSCAGCHERAYGTVLRWWSEGDRQRLARAATYLNAARADLREARGDSAAALLDEAAGLLDVAREGSGVHNLALAYRVYSDVVDLASRAYRAVGRTPPAAPGFGPRPRQGLCSYCHYRIDDPWPSLEISGVGFHRGEAEGG